MDSPRCIQVPGTPVATAASAVMPSSLTGCGEQNMVTLAPNVYVAKYLLATGKMMLGTRKMFWCLREPWKKGSGVANLVLEFPTYVQARFLGSEHPDYSLSDKQGCKQPLSSRFRCVLLPTNTIRQGRISRTSMGKNWVTLFTRAHHRPTVLNLQRNIGGSRFWSSWWNLTIYKSDRRSRHWNAGATRQRLDPGALSGGSLHSHARGRWRYFGFIGAMGGWRANEAKTRDGATYFDLWPRCFRQGVEIATFTTRNLWRCQLKTLDTFQFQ